MSLSLCSSTVRVGSGWPCIELEKEENIRLDRLDAITAEWFGKGGHFQSADIIKLCIRSPLVPGAEQIYDRLKAQHGARTEIAENKYLCMMGVYA